MAGKAEKKLEVLADITTEEIEEISSYLEKADFEVKTVESGCVFDIVDRASERRTPGCCADQGHHTNVVHVEKDGKILVTKYMQRDRKGNGRTEAFSV